MRDPEMVELYLKLANPHRDRTNDGALLAELAQHARSVVDEGELDNGTIGNSLHAIAESPTLLPRALSIWLSAEEDTNLGKALQRQATVTRLDQAHPESYDLSGLDEAQAVLAGYRLCAMAAAPAISLGWTLSLARDFPESEPTSRAVRDLVDYHCFEVPSSTKRLLSSERSVFGEMELSRGTLTRLEQQDIELAALPHLREFDMTSDMRLLFSTLKRNENRDIQRQAREQSILSLFATQFRLKYGTRAAIPIRGDSAATETTLTMASYELSVELPLSEVTDAVLGNIKRNRLWKGARA